MAGPAGKTDSCGRRHRPLAALAAPSLPVGLNGYCYTKSHHWQPDSPLRNGGAVENVQMEQVALTGPSSSATSPRSYAITLAQLQCGSVWAGNYLVSYSGVMSMLLATRVNGCTRGQPSREQHAQGCAK